MTLQRDGIAFNIYLPAEGVSSCVKKIRKNKKNDEENHEDGKFTV